jgi:5'-nucleotidase
VVHEGQLPDVGAARVLAVQASPGFIAFTGARSDFGERPDPVLSGINRGPDTGTAILHFGTVGATLTGATHGIPAGTTAAAAPGSPESAAG